MHIGKIAFPAKPVAVASLNPADMNDSTTVLSNIKG
jgi:hypothetical protein